MVSPFGYVSTFDCLWFASLRRPSMSFTCEISACRIAKCHNTWKARKCSDNDEGNGFKIGDAFRFFLPISNRNWWICDRFHELIRTLRHFVGFSPSKIPFWGKENSSVCNHCRQVPGLCRSWKHGQPTFVTAGRIWNHSCAVSRHLRASAMIESDVLFVCSYLSSLPELYIYRNTIDNMQYV